MPPVGAIGQQLQRDQRAHDGVAPALVVAMRSGSACDHSRHHVTVRSRLSVRSGTKCGALCERWYDSVNGTLSPSRTVNVASVFRSRPSSAHVGVQLDGVGAGDGATGRSRAAAPTARRGRSRSAGQLHAQSTLAAKAAHDAHDVDFVLVLRERHEVDQRDCAAVVSSKRVSRIAVSGR